MSQPSDEALRAAKRLYDHSTDEFWEHWALSVDEALCLPELLAVEKAVRRGFESLTLNAEAHGPIDDKPEGHTWCVDCGEAWPCSVEEMRRGMAALDAARKRDG